MEDVSQGNNPNTLTDTDNERGEVRNPNPQGVRPKRNRERQLKMELTRAQEVAAKKDE